MKQFCATLCCESYPIAATMDEEVVALESRWPRFHEQDEPMTQGSVRWGDYRFGRLAPFLREDAGPTFSSVCTPAGPESSQRTTPQALYEDASVYQRHFDRTLQENQKCAQHHIHKRDSKTGQRRIPNACQAYRAPTKCKHDFPQEQRMNAGPALLICKGIARKRGLELTRPRTALGSILGKRNNAWLNGSAPGLIVGLSGGNSDVKLNDRLPITEKTHEATHCKRRCVPKCPAKRKRALARLVRRMQTAQAQTNGYFGGYIGKRQKCGKLETRKCVDKMHVLRARQEGKSEFEQQRSVSGRMITDIEMNGTLRGAVEEFNLCANLRSNDVLFAECVRTFNTITLNAQPFFYRLEVELGRLKEMTAPIPCRLRGNQTRGASEARRLGLTFMDSDRCKTRRSHCFRHLSPYNTSTARPWRLRGPGIQIAAPCGQRPAGKPNITGSSKMGRRRCVQGFTI